MFDIIKFLILLIVDLIKTFFGFMLMYIWIVVMFPIGLIMSLFDDTGKKDW
jgi:hypothetical protein